MAFTNLTQLLKTVADYLVGDGEAVSDERVLDFVALAEQQMNSRLRTYRQEQKASVVIGECSSGALPSDFLSIRNVYVPGNPNRQLYYIGPAQVEETYPYRTSGFPYHYSIMGAEISVYPSSASTVSIRYYQKIPPLADNDDNWILQNYPKAYLFGCLNQATLYKLGTDEKAQQYEAHFEQTLAAISNDDIRARYPRAAARISGITP